MNTTYADYPPAPAAYVSAPTPEKEIQSPWLMSRLSWGSIIAGCIVALSVHLLLTMLGIGLGFRLVNPYTDENPALGFTTAAGVAWSISALISLWVGGWIAGRTSGKGYGNTGGLHGIVVWGVATILSFTIFSSTVGLLAGGAAAALGKVGAATAQAAGNALPAVGQAVSSGNVGGPNALGSFLDEVAPNGGAAQAGNGNPSFNVTRARRDVGEALYRNFTIHNSDTRNALVQALVNAAGKSPEEAAATVQEWETSYNQIKADWDQAKEKAAQEAKVAADRVSQALTVIATWTFLMFGVGAFAAAWGGRCGGERARVFHSAALNRSHEPAA